MPFRHASIRKAWRSYPVRVGFFALVWLLAITAAHLYLNTDREERTVLKMGYMPVITNLAAPILDAASSITDVGIRFKAIKFASFAEMAEALRNREIDAAFIIAPLSIVLHQQGADVRVVYIGNRHESTLVVRKELAALIPDRFNRTNDCRADALFGAQHRPTANGRRSRNRAGNQYCGDESTGYGLGPRFRRIRRLFRRRALAAQTLKSGTSELLFYVEEVWPEFICNLLLVKKSYIDDYPDRVQSLVEGAARSGFWAKLNTTRAAQIASEYWGQPVELVRYALTTPQNRIVYDRFLPREEELGKLAQMMLHFGLSEDDNVEGLVEDRFAKGADVADVHDFDSILKGRE